MKPRYLKGQIIADLKEKMVFLGGPRQVGKTTLAKSLLPQSNRYFNWDDSADRGHILKRDFSQGPLIVFDELHKFPRWRSYVKGLFDKDQQSILVTGSARLDYYRRGGDSLAGRYHYLRLHPFTITEMSRRPTTSDVNQLLRFGGFPEPLFKSDEVHHRRWQREQISRVVTQDIRDLENVREIGIIELLVDALPERVGSPLSIKNLREMLEVSHYTVERWVQILERLYVCFRIPPYGSPKIRAVKKEQKLYLWDWSLVQDPGARFENMVASHLLKYCHFVEDTFGHRMELRFIRDTDKREVDFVVLKDRRPLFAVESKTGESTRSSAIGYFSDRTQVPIFYQVHLGTKDQESERRRILPFRTFCQELGIP